MVRMLIYMCKSFFYNKSAIFGPLGQARIQGVAVGADAPPSWIKGAVHPQDKS